jgi:phage protein D
MTVTKILFYIMSYLNMNAIVTIGDVRFEAINSFTITQSVEFVSDTATITLAKNYGELGNRKVLDYISAGKPVTIEFGYNGNLETEFKGFVKPNIGADYPLIVEADALFYLRQNNFKISERNISLKALLEIIAPQFNIECIDVQLGKVYFSNESTVQILEKLKKEFGFFSRITNNTLHVGWAFDFVPSFTKKHTYTVGENVRSIEKLKYSTEIDFNTKVRIKIHQPNGKVEEVVYGMKPVGSTMQPLRIGESDKVKDETGAIKTYTVSDVSVAVAEQMAKAQLQRILYSGYKGSIDGFGLPRTKAGDSLQIINTVMPEREGTYLIDKVVVSYDDANITRENFITYKVA